MNVPIAVALVGGCTASLAPAISYYLTKRNERAVVRHNLKLSHYQEFIDAIAGNLIDHATDESRLRFGRATNTMYLVASNEVIRALHLYLDNEIRGANPNTGVEEHIRLLSRLAWEIRADLGDPPTTKPEDFIMRLWSPHLKRTE